MGPVTCCCRSSIRVPSFSCVAPRPSSLSKLDFPSFFKVMHHQFVVWLVWLVD